MAIFVTPGIEKVSPSMVTMKFDTMLRPQFLTK